MKRDNKQLIGFVKSPLFWRNFLLISFIVSLIPILMIAKYNHSCADDFSFGIQVHKAWLQTHSIFEVIKAIGNTVLVIGKTWQGTYSAIALFTIQPAVWGEQYYFLTTYILLAFLTLGIFSFFRSWIGRIYKNNRIADIVSCCVSIAFIQMVPTPVESLFWWNGASYYVIWTALLLVQVSCFLSVAHAKKCSILQCVVMSALGILLAGSNFITALLTVEVTVIFLANCIYSHKNWRQAAVVLLITIVGFIISVTAPGNAVRQQHFATMNPILAIVKSFLYTYRWAITWTPDMLILMLLFCLPFAIGIQIKAKEKTKQIPLWIKLSLLICLFVSTFTPTLYSGNGIGPERAQNIRFLLWVILCIASEFLVAEHAINWIKKNGHSSALENLQVWFTPKKAILLLGVLAVAVFLSGMRGYYFNKFDCFTSVSAAHSLITGDAQEYDRVADEREQLLLSEETNVVLPPFTTRPYLLYFNDVTSDPSDLSNIAMAEYYGKESIIVREPD